MRLLIVVVCSLLFSGCTSAAVEKSEDVAAPETSETAAATSPVDFSCKTDADCAVKNVGNCCGYFPACVNAASPTFPEQVRAACANEGVSSVCGFADISRCECVDSQCRAASAEAAAMPLN